MVPIRAAIASPRRRRTIAARTATGLGVGAGVAIQKTVPRRFGAPPGTGRASDARRVQKPFDVANADTGSVIANTELTAPVDMGVDDWLHGVQLPNCFFELLRCISAALGSKGIFRATSNGPLLVFNRVSAMSFPSDRHALTRKFRIMPMSSCSRLWPVIEKHAGVVGKAHQQPHALARHHQHGILPSFIHMAFVPCPVRRQARRSPPVHRGNVCVPPVSRKSLIALHPSIAAPGTCHFPALALG